MRPSLPGRTAAALAYADRSLPGLVGELTELVRIPSVSGDRARAGDVRRCALWLATRLRALGAGSVRLLEGERHPMVVGEWRHAGAGAPTVLFYAHYDVQPAGPLGAWRWPPFEPRVHERALHGRGASDDKGPLLAQVKAVESYLRTSGELPVNVACVFEGEEEIAGSGLVRRLRKSSRLAGIDLAVVCDTRMRDREHPTLTYALRGSLGLELDVQGAASDLHAGAFGGAVHGALQALSEMLARLHGADRRVAVPGFYARVRAPSAAERARLAKAGPGDDAFLREARAPVGWGDDDYSLYERTVLRPAVNVASVAGSLGEAGKAAIPARARATLDVRLVPDQEPGEIERLIRQHVARITPPTVRSTLRRLRSAPPVVVDTGSAVVRAAAAACARGFGTPPVFLRSGGTIPVVSALAERGVPTVLLGLALPDDGMHAPNEKCDLGVLHAGVATCVHLLAALADLGSAPRARPGAAIEWIA